jgi:hypothetical protein
LAKTNDRLLEQRRGIVGHQSTDVIESARKRKPRGFPVLWPYMDSHQAQSREQDGGIVAVAQHRQHVGNEVERQDEIGERAKERSLHVRRRGAIERAIVGGEKIFGERKRSGDAFGLCLEFAPQALRVTGCAANLLFEGSLISWGGAPKHGI